MGIQNRAKNESNCKSFASVGRFSFKVLGEKRILVDVEVARVENRVVFREQHLLELCKRKARAACRAATLNECATYDMSRALWAPMA